MKLMRVSGDVVAELIDVPDTVRVLAPARLADGDEPPAYIERSATVEDYFPADAGFVPHDGRAEIGWVRKGKMFVPPPPPPAPPLVDVKTRARAQVIAFADQITARITGQYPAAEVASWPTQEAEARAVVAGAAAADAPLISVLAAASKMPLADYANGVLAKAAAFRQVVASVKAIRDVTEAAIEAAATPEAVAGALEQARQAALAKAAALGLA